MRELTQNLAEIETIDKNFRAIDLAEVNSIDFSQFNPKAGEVDGLGPSQAVVLEHNGYYYSLVVLDYVPDYMFINLLMPIHTWLENPPRQKAIEFLEEITDFGLIHWFNEWYYLTLEDKIKDDVKRLNVAGNADNLKSYLVRTYKMTQAQAEDLIA